MSKPIKYFLFFYVLIQIVPLNVFGLNTKFGFIKNEGQILDQNRKQNTKVVYYHSGNSMNVHLNNEGFSYELFKYPESNINQGKKFQNFGNTRPNVGNLMPISFNRIDIELVGCNTEALFLPDNEQSSVLNFYNEYTPDKGFEGINHFNTVIRKNIYPNIDIVFTCENGFKYTFVVHPGGNPSQIRLRVNGSLKSALNEAGNLEFSCKLGTIKEHIPLSYLINENENQNQKAVDVKYKHYSDSEFGFLIQDIPKNQTLVIDPSPWATYFGGSGYDNGNSIKIDSSGSSIVIGYTYSTFGIATSGAYQSTYGGNNDGFILKFNEFGNLVWATYYGGNDNDYCYDVTISKQGYLLVAGLTGSTNGIATSGSFQDSLNGVTDAFVLKFTGSGTRVWATYFGGNFLDYGYGIASDDNENIFLSGYTNSDQNVATVGSHQSSFGGNNDAMIAKFNPNGNLIWASYYGGSTNEYGTGITCDPQGNVLFTGFTASSSGIATSNAYQSQLGGSGTTNDAYLVKFNTYGLRIWGTYFGGSSNEDGRSLTCDENGTIYLTGTTLSSNGIASSGVFQSINKGENDVYLASFDSSGAKKWGTYFGSDVDEFSNSVVLDKLGNPVIVGFTNSALGIASANAYQLTLGGNEDAFIAKFDTTGNRIWSTYYGGTLGDYAYSVAIGKNNYVLVTGLTNSISNISTSGAWQTTLAGTNDMFLISLTGNGNLIPITKNAIFGSQTICGGTSPAPIIGLIPSGGSGVYNYSWLISYTDSNSGFTLAPGSNSLANYVPGNFAYKYWLRRKVISGGDIDTSNAVSMNLFPKPSAQFNINLPTQCAKFNDFFLTDQSTLVDSVIRYTWDFGDGMFDSSNQISIHKSYAISGSYSIKLVKQNYWGCKDSLAKTILVNPLPLAITNTTQFTTFCAGNSITLHTNLNGGKKGVWIKNLNPLLDTLSDLEVRNSGIYQCIQTNEFGCSDTSNSVTVIVNPKPIGKIESPDSLVICAGDFALLLAQQKNLNYYQWYKNGSKLFGSNQYSYATDIPGNFQLIVRNEFGCYDTSQQIKVNQNPKPALSTITGTNSIVLIVPITLKPYTYKVSPKAGSTFNWYVNNLPVSLNGPDSLEVTWTQKGTFVLKLIEKNSFSCQSDTAYLPVMIDLFNGLNRIEYNTFGLYPNPSSGKITLQISKPNENDWVVLNMFGQLVHSFKIKGLETSLDLSFLENGTYFIKPQNINGYQVEPKKVIILH
ncbi:MAG: hypothetical protein CFE21_06800 [Bacteroidetes bacterium B1(2017)]|nr:MAG: hypothetical protein CFE21_06800 [Bacteroidetes bacterium B1(2017)]